MGNLLESVLKNFEHGPDPRERRCPQIVSEACSGSQAFELIGTTVSFARAFRPPLRGGLDWNHAEAQTAHREKSSASGPAKV